MGSAKGPVDDALACAAWVVLLSALATIESAGESWLTWQVRAALLGGLAMPLAQLARALPLRRSLAWFSGSRIRWLWFMLVFLPLACLGEWVADEITSATLLSRRGLLLRGIIGSLAAGAAAVLASAVVPRTRVREVSAQGLIFWGGLTLLGLATLAEPQAQRLTFWVLWVVHAVAKLILVAILAALAPRFHRVGWVGVLGVAPLLSWILASPESLQQSYARLGFERRAEFFALIALRELLDKDRDGFAAWFGGGDCDDNDPSAFPLGPKDCDELLPDVPPEPPAPTSFPRVDRVLLVTIDAWRCELAGQALCPQLSKLAESASYAGRSRTFSSQTVHSLAALFGGRVRIGSLPTEPSPVVTAARDRGFYTHAVISYPGLSHVSIGGSFASLDKRTSLNRKTESDVRSQEQTRALSAKLDELNAAHDKLLIWTHYLEPHAPHTEAAEGEPVGYFQLGRVRTYAAEVRRTDKDVADLLNRSVKNGFGRSAAIIVTGDHGESFEHGHYYHGHTSYDTEVVVPLFVWVYDPQGDVVPLSLPESPTTQDVSALLAGVLGVSPPTKTSRATIIFGWNHQFSVTDGDYKYVYHWKKRFAELYDLRKDPGERLNLVGQRPAVETRLRKRLGEELFHVLR